MTRPRAKTSKLPLPVALLIVAFLCPTELSLYAGDLRLPPHRLALLILTPIAIFKLFAQSRLKFRGFDAAFLAFALWTIAVFVMHQGQSEGFVYGGSLALESLGGYLVARVWIRSPQDFDAALRGMAIAICVAATIALPETLFGKTFMHDALKALTGYAHPTAIETRLGLTRAYGTFDHPIHYGTFCAALLAMFWFAAKSRHERRSRAVLLCSATFLGLSSAPLLCLALQAAMIAWEKTTRGAPSRTSLTLAAMAALYFGASLVMTRSPINFIATGLTLDSWTGYYRLQIWEHGLENVFANPWIGIGLSDWTRPWWMVSSTVDAFWLVVAMRQGVPAVALLVLGIALIGRAVVTRGVLQPNIAVRRIARGWLMSLVALSLIACTVHFWNVLFAFFFFFLGLAGWMADPLRQRAASASQRARRYHARAREIRPQLAPAFGAAARV